MQNKIIQTTKIFKLTDKDVWHIRALKGLYGHLFEHLNEEQLSKKCGFYDRLWEWFKKECKNCTFSYPDDEPAIVIDIENKEIRFTGLEVIHV